MFAGNPAYTDERMRVFLEKLPYFREQLEDKHVTRLLLWEEYRRENPDGYGKSQFFFHLKQNLVAQKQVGVLRNVYNPGEILMIDFAGDKLSYIDTQAASPLPLQSPHRRWKTLPTHSGCALRRLVAFLTWLSRIT